MRILLLIIIMCISLSSCGAMMGGGNYHYDYVKVDDNVTVTVKASSVREYEQLLVYVNPATGEVIIVAEDVSGGENTTGEALGLMDRLVKIFGGVL